MPANYVMNSLGPSCYKSKDICVVAVRQAPSGDFVGATQAWVNLQQNLGGKRCRCAIDGGAALLRAQNWYGYRIALGFQTQAFERKCGRSPSSLLTSMAFGNNRISKSPISAAQLPDAIRIWRPPV